ncbi:MAG: hypothetical protein U0Q18_27235 [Bryobacteraceae bacterium]
MKTLVWLVAITFLAIGAETINFDSTAPGKVPPGWTIALSHRGAPPKWEVVKDPSAPSPPYVLAQISHDKAGARCPLAILNKVNVQDGELSVKLKPVSGQEERAGGLVWRFHDPNNYYLVRANALENNIVLCKVENGREIPLAVRGTRTRTFAVGHEIPANEWSVLKVQFRGPLFSVYFNRRRVFQVVDSTFADPGRVGLWTKADSVTYFDDFRVTGR